MNQVAGSKTLIQHNRATRENAPDTLYPPPKKRPQPAYHPAQTSPAPVEPRQQTIKRNRHMARRYETLYQAGRTGPARSWVNTCTSTSCSCESAFYSSPGDRRVRSESHVRVIARYSGAAHTWSARNGDMALLGAIVRFDNAQLSV